jgi:hypothetical protein
MILAIVGLLSMFVAHCPVRAVTTYQDQIVILDQSLSGRPIVGAILTISGIKGTLTTGTDGAVELRLVPAGFMGIVVKWKSAYNPVPVTIAASSITLDRTIEATIISTVYDVELQLVSPTGKPIENAHISLAGVWLGVTGADGKVLATQVPSWYTSTHQAYPVTATWFGVDVSPGEVTVTTTKTYILTAKNVATLTVHVVGAQGQGLSAAQVEIKTSAGQMAYSGAANEQGIGSAELPYGTYGIRVDYKGFTNTASATVSTAAGTVQTIATNVFIEVFGMAMTFATFLLWVAVFILLALAMAVAFHEYHIWRRKRLPQFFGAPRVPGVYS